MRFRLRVAVISMDVLAFERCFDTFRASIDTRNYICSNGAAMYVGHHDNMTEVIMTWRAAGDSFGGQ
ncbi:hypothetical protein SBA1_730013 [Candidatus Sulfotelmatobacter kueseliae]|uniref:Uncharacterized protein n=1 Tax=Candidatus Sulfotelmatobacter kueseliae TaxID=2042962 RepID=A0A2U3L5W1_9BACT|nr:hypothetical protein SBA1_730013 [Candidatus Sulfotelmatobacter kueseliae]